MHNEHFYSLVQVMLNSPFVLFVQAIHRFPMNIENLFILKVNKNKTYLFTFFEHRSNKTLI